MNKLFIVMIAVLLLYILLMIIKVVKSKKIFDRMNGLSVINAHVIIILLVIGYLDGRPEMYIDIAIAYGFLGFVSNIIVAKYLGKNRKEGEDEE